MLLHASPTEDFRTIVPQAVDEKVVLEPAAYRARLRVHIFDWYADAPFSDPGQRVTFLHHRLRVHAATPGPIQPIGAVEPFVVLRKIGAVTGRQVIPPEPANLAAIDSPRQSPAKHEVE